MPPIDPNSNRAVRATVHGKVQGVGFRWATLARAHELGVLGWVRNQDDGTVYVHAEGSSEALATFLGFLGEGPPAASVDDVDVREVKIEGHEQFAQRGVTAGRFLVADHTGDRPAFIFALEVDGATRAWHLAKQPSMDPADKRMAFELIGPDLDVGFPDHHGVPHPPDYVAPPIWDAGDYEQGGRVPWPEAIERGHAVFVLHGEKLQGGFALQRIRGEDLKAQWLLVKRRETGTP